MMRKEDLGLSLSLSFPYSHHLNLTHSSANTCSSHSGVPLQKPSWNDVVSPPPDPNSGYFPTTEARTFLRGIDVNRFPSTVDGEEEAGVSSPNNTISSVSRKRSEREENGGIGDDEDGDTSRKKRVLVTCRPRNVPSEHQNVPRIVRPCPTTVARPRYIPRPSPYRPRTRDVSGT
ncbi:homeobox-leucine zipper protein HAT4-like [Hibiscus syriacus]|uniref:homeobox-leucine zipper protein HAT4-like n=1 Tax=Hibiscus syriacus TaxID=106335 RepID=UPI001920459F|nr:homeobox-leucine zipper protein HAT4-like [Hibiscus syriacus]